MKISNDILHAVREFNLEPGSGLLGMSEKVNHIFHKTEQWWHFILNIFTFGWYNADRKEQIKAALKYENDMALGSTALRNAGVEACRMNASAWGKNVTKDNVKQVCRDLKLNGQQYRLMLQDLGLHPARITYDRYNRFAG
jgi:hypothetical protein